MARAGQFDAVASQPVEIALCESSERLLQQLDLGLDFVGFDSR